jgi:hypothetical protein
VDPDRATVPMPWFILTVVASGTAQLSVELPPSVILAGSALKELIVGLAGVTPPHAYNNREKMTIIKNTIINFL